MFCKVYDRCILKDSLVAKCLSYVKYSLQTAFENIAEFRHVSPPAPLLSPLFSSHLLSLIFPLLSAATLYWHVFVLSFHPFPWHLTMEVVAVSGILLLFFCTAFVPPLSGNKEKNILSFCVYKTCRLFCAKHKMWICLWGYIDLWRNWDKIGYNYQFDIFCCCLRYPSTPTLFSFVINQITILFFTSQQCLEMSNVAPIVPDLKILFNKHYLANINGYFSVR